MLRVLLFAVTLGLAAMGATCLHPTSVASARVKVSADGSVEMHIRFDVLAYMLDLRPPDVDDAAMRALLHAPAEDLALRLAVASQRFPKGLIIASEKGQAVVHSITFPTAAEIIAWRQRNSEEQLPIMLTAVAKGSLPAGSRKTSMTFPEALDTVILTVEFPYREPISEPVEAGSSSRWLRIPTPSQVSNSANTAATDTAKRSKAIPPVRQKAKGKPTMEQPAKPQESFFSRLVKESLETLRRRLLHY
jgi:hypothetical protein